MAISEWGSRRRIEFGNLRRGLMIAARQRRLRAVVVAARRSRLCLGQRLAGIALLLLGEPAGGERGGKIIRRARRIVERAGAGIRVAPGMPNCGHSDR